MRPGAVEIGVCVSPTNCLDRVDGEPRGDLAGDVAAHAVGHDEQAEVRPGAVASSLVARRSPGCDTAAQRTRMRFESPATAVPAVGLDDGRQRWRGRGKRPADRMIALASAIAGALVVEVGAALREPGLGALARLFGAGDVDVLGAFGDSAPARSRVRQHFGEAAARWRGSASSCAAPVPHHRRR